MVLTTLNIRVSEGMKTEVETLVNDIGLWENRSDFVRDAINDKIQKHWQGERMVKNPLII